MSSNFFQNSYSLPAGVHIVRSIILCVNLALEVMGGTAMAWRHINQNSINVNLHVRGINIMDHI